MVEEVAVLFGDFSAFYLCIEFLFLLGESFFNSDLSRGVFVQFVFVGKVLSLIMDHL